MIEINLELIFRMIKSKFCFLVSDSKLDEDSDCEIVDVTRPRESHAGKHITFVSCYKCT